MVTKGPLVAAARTRSAVVGGVMMLLLGGSLVVAWAVTGAAVVPPSAPPPVVVSISGASVALPRAWELEASTLAAGKPVSQWSFVNQASPGERLRVVRFTASEPTDPGPVLGKWVLPQLLAGRMMKMSAEGPPLRYERAPGEDGDQIDVVFSTQMFSPQRVSKVQSPLQLHAVRMLTPDQTNFWVFQLTDLVPEELWRRELENGQMQQLRTLLESFSYDESAAP